MNLSLDGRRCLRIADFAYTIDLHVWRLQLLAYRK